MRAAIVVILAGLLVAGCGAGRAGSSASSARPATRPATPAVSAIPSAPPDDPSLSRTDRADHTPADVVLALIAATNRHDWRTAYGLLAAPAQTSYTTFVRESTQAAEVYRDFTVLETRVIGAGKGKGDALVRVAFSCDTTPGAAARHTVVVKPPGQWWSVEKVDGLWRVNWLAAD